MDHLPSIELGNAQLFGLLIQKMKKGQTGNNPYRMEQESVPVFHTITSQWLQGRRWSKGFCRRFVAEFILFFTRKKEMGVRDSDEGPFKKE